MSLRGLKDTYAPLSFVYAGHDASYMGILPLKTQRFTQLATYENLVTATSLGHKTAPLIPGVVHTVPLSQGSPSNINGSLFLDIQFTK
jgi:hypothetical protein